MKRMRIAEARLLDPEVFNDHPGFGEGPKLLAVEAFIAEAPVEALHEPILPGTGRLDVDGLNLVLCQPENPGPLSDFRP